MRLGDLGTRHVWFTSLGYPAGHDLVLEKGADALHLPGDVLGGDESPWWDLEGTVSDNKWEWDGEGKPTDWRGNSVTKMTAFA